MGDDMLDEKKIRLMTKLARYEKGQGKEDMRIARYYRSDYLGISLFKNFFLVSIGYAIILLLICAYFSEYLLDNVHKMNLLLLAAAVIGGYIIMITVYSMVTYAICSLRFSKARRAVQMYQHKLAELETFYSEEDDAQKRKSRRNDV